MALYRGMGHTLEEALQNTVVVKSIQDLILHLYNISGGDNFLSQDDIKIEPYCFDPRIGWYTHTVCIKCDSGDWSIVGFLSEPLN